MTATGRVPRSCPASSAVSRSPRTQHCVSRSSAGWCFPARPSGASNWISGTPGGMPSPLTAGVECMCRPRVPLERLFLPISPGPTQPGHSAKLRSLPSWMHSTTAWPSMRSSVRARWGARMLAGVTAASAGWSIMR